MGIWKKVKFGLAYLRGRRRYKKDLKKMSKTPPLTPSVPTKPITKSATTKAVAGGATSGTAIAGILAGIRATYPDLLPWPVEADAAIATTIGIVLIPLLSRLFKGLMVKG